MKRWIILGVLAVVVLAALGTAGYFIAKRIHHENILKGGQALYEAGEWKDARHELGRYINNYPEAVDVLRQFADASLHVADNRRGAINTAVNAYKQIYGVQPSDGEAQRRLIELYKKIDEWAAVEFYCDLILDEQPADPEWLRNQRAIALQEQGSEAEAIEAYRELVAEDKAEGEVYVRLAGLLRETAPAESAETLDEGLRRLGDDPAFLAQAALQLAQDDEARAEELLSRAAKADADHPEVLKAQARMAMAEQNWAAAEALAERLREADPSEGEAYFVLSAARNAAGNAEGAVHALQEAGDLTLADNPQLILTLAEAQIGTGQLEEARETLSFYRKAHPNHELAFRYLEGRLMLADGDTAGAIQEFLAVSQANPDFSMARVYLAEAYRAAGQMRLARDTLEAYLRVSPDDPAALALAEALGMRQGPPPGRLADRLLEDPGAPLAQMRQTAGRLLRSAIQKGFESDDARRVVELFERLVERAPGDRAAYADYARSLMAMGETERAREVIAQGVEQVGGESLALVRAELDLVDNQPDQAFQRFQGLDLGSLNGEDYLRWARAFRRNRELENAMAVVNQGLEALPEEEKAPLLAERATILARQGDTGAARDVLRTVDSELDAEEARALRDARVALAQALVAQDTEAAREAARLELEEVLRERPDDAGAMALRAELLLASDPPSRAEAYVWLQRALDVDPGNVPALLQLGRLTLDEGEVGEALQYASAVLAEAPGLLDAQLLAAEAEHALGLSDRALARAQAVVGIAPRDPRALELLADIHLALDNLDSAADAIERLEAAAPERASHALMLQGMLAEARGEESEAEAKLRAELRRNPSHLETAEALAGLLRRKGRFEEGRALLEETASLEETGPAAWVALGSYCLSADAGGREADAIRAFSRALMADPNHAPALRRLVDAHMARGGLAEALAFAERYLDLRPDDASVWNLKALVLLDLNRDPSKALEAVERAQEVSDRPQYRLTHALILIEMGEEDRAREEVRQAEEAMGPTSAQIDLALAQALLDVGQVDEARHYAGRARTKAEEGQIVNTEQLARLEERIAQEG